MTKQAFNEKKFFNCGSKLVKNNILAPPISNEIDSYQLIVADYQGIDFPVIFKQREGKKITDFIDTGFPNLFLISDKTKDILKKNNVTGWGTYPIKLFDKKGVEIEGYHGFSVLGKCGPRDFSNCEIIEKQFVPGGPVAKYYKGVSIAYWDGHDFCIPEDTCQIVVSEKTAKILLENKISNVRLENLAEKETYVSSVR